MARRPIGSGPVDFMANMSPQVRDALLCMPRLVAYSLSESAWTAAAAADVKIISGLNIPSSSMITISWLHRMAADATNTGYVGLKLNTTIVNEANAADNLSVCVTNAAAKAASGLVTILPRPSGDTNYLGVYPKVYGPGWVQRISGAGGTTLTQVGLTNPIPVGANTTDITFRGGASGGTTSQGIRDVYVWEWPLPPFALP